MITAKTIEGFELYMEGVRVPFNSISLTEAAGQFPQASIYMPASVKFNTLLPKTIIQLFGPDPLTNKSVLLFEGELVSYAYSKGENGKTLSISARSMLNGWAEARIKPLDSVTAAKYAYQSGSLDETNMFVNALSMAADSFIGENLVEPPPTTDKAQKNVKVEGATASDGGFFDEILQLFQDSRVKKGDYQVIFNELLNLFLKKDPFYSINNFAYKFNQTLYCLPNAIANDKIVTNFIFEKLATLQNMFKQGLKEKNDLLLFQALQQILEAIQYQPLFFSTPTASTSFGLEASYKAPLRALALPDLKHAPPIVNNIFFWDGVSGFSLSKNPLAEPTRTLGTYGKPIVSELDSYKSLSVWDVVPKQLLSEKEMAENFAPFTLEESYRGINPQHQSFSFFLSKALAEEYKTAEPSSDEIQPYNDALRHWTLKAHYDAKYATRSFSMSVDWNPYRVVGFPAVYIDDDSLLVTGVLNSVSTTISANGQISSQVAFSNVRVLGLDDVNLTTPNTIKEAHAVMLDSVEGYPDILTALYDEALYSFKNVGKEVYPLVTDGDFLKDSVLAQKLGTDFWTEWAGNYPKNRLSGVSDKSILAYKGTLSKDVEKLPTHITNTLYLKSAALNLRAQYLKTQTSGTSDNWLLNLTRRSLLPKETYFQFIGVKNSAESYINSKNLYGTLDATTYKKVKDYVKTEKAKANEISSSLRLAQLYKLPNREAAATMEGQQHVETMRLEKRLKQYYNSIKNFSELKNNPDAAAGLGYLENLFNSSAPAYEEPATVEGKLWPKISQSAQRVQFMIIYNELYEARKLYLIAKEVNDYYKYQNLGPQELEQAYTVERSKEFNKINVATELQKPYILTRRIAVETAMENIIAVTDAGDGSPYVNGLDTEKKLSNLHVNRITR